MVAALSRWHEQHETAAAAARDVTALPAHVLLEAYSVLTRLPSGLAVPPPVAAKVLARRFPGAPLHLSADDRSTMLSRLAEAGVSGGSSYDGLVALEALAHERALLTLDRRAQLTYARLGARFTVLAG